MSKKNNQLVYKVLIIGLCITTGCANYGAFQGFTEDGLYISPSAIQRGLIEPQMFAPSDTSSIWRANYLTYASQDSYLWEELLKNEVEELAIQGLGMDVIEIDQTGFDGRGPALKTGWILSERSQFFIINELAGRSPTTFFLLQTSIKPYWDVVITQSGDAREGIDLQYRRDY